MVKNVAFAYGLGRHSMVKNVAFARRKIYSFNKSRVRAVFFIITIVKQRNDK